MANITPTFLASNSPNVKVVAWLNVTESDTCLAVNAGEFPDRSVQVRASASGGTFGTLGHMVFEGTNAVPANWQKGGRPDADTGGVTSIGTDFITLTDPLGNNLDFTAAGLKQLTELPAQVRPRVSAGTGVKLDCYLSMRRTR